MFDDFKDNMIFTDNETGDRVIFHRKTWLYIIFGILTHYLRYTDDYAEEIINESFLCSKEELNFHSVGMLCHDEEYHWTMLLYMGTIIGIMVLILSFQMITMIGWIVI